MNKPANSELTERMNELFLIVGLGNPTHEYTGTRHNIGFRCVEALAEKHGMTFDKKQKKAKVANGQIEGYKVLLAKPQTYMNLSGEAVKGLADFYKIPASNIMVIFDDLDLPAGTLRIRQSGGSSGQKGMKSIIQHLGTQDFPRIRFGIGRPPGKMDPAAYVLRPFDTEEEILVIETVDRVLRAVSTWLTEGIDQTMNQHNGTIEDVARRQAIMPPKAPNSSTGDDHKPPCN